ncbi:MAG TPA: prephenate dehydratase domain-containing protein, partial [Gemmatales bacterium]|nr:prephenate dehydratase domain-containing protein [Gemmatales bacterium]
GAAAVASRQAAVRYGLKILFEHIEDNVQNETRFAVIGKSIAERSGRDKTAIMFQTSNMPGSLLDALLVFKNNKINLSMIESFPARSGKGEYVFFVDFDGHVDDAKVKKTLDALEKHSKQIVILGSFTHTEALE